MRSLPIFIFLLMTLATPSWASTFHWQLKVFEKNDSSLADTESTVSAGDWTCKVSAVKKEQEGVSSESRRLSCSVGNGLQATIFVKCATGPGTTNKRFDANLLRLQQKKGDDVVLMLSCS